MALTCCKFSHHQVHDNVIKSLKDSSTWKKTYSDFNQHCRWPSTFGLRCLQGQITASRLSGLWLSGLWLHAPLHNFPLLTSAMGCCCPSLDLTAVMGAHQMHFGAALLILVLEMWFNLKSMCNVLKKPFPKLFYMSYLSNKTGLHRGQWWGNFLFSGGYLPQLNSLRPRQMDAISQTPFSNAFSWMKMFEFRLKFHWSLFPRVQLTISQHWFR